MKLPNTSRVNNMKNKSIAVLCGGPGSEREVSLKTGQAVYDALTKGGYTKVSITDASTGLEGLAADKPDICFNALHGTYGEDGVLQGFLDMLRIPYTGSGLEASALAYDKHFSKLCFEAAGIPTPEYKLLGEGELPAQFPCVIKPARAGSTIGITILQDASEAAFALALAREQDSKILAEQFIDGKELTVSIFNGQALPLIDIRPISGFYDYKSKYTRGMTDYVFDHGLSEAEEALILKTALDAYNVLGCTGAARTDVIYDGKTPWVLEVNTMPGMTSNSLLPKAAAEKGISFLELLEMMLADGFKRGNKRY
jgi:D-alanine-D-alanine ligase